MGYVPTSFQTLYIMTYFNMNKQLSHCLKKKKKESIFFSLLGKISHIMTWVGLFYLNLIFNIMEDETSLPPNLYIIGITIDNT